MIGDTLRRGREAKGLSIKDVEKGTSIRALYIEALEKGDYATLPGEVYAKGFLRNYANFIGLDADMCLRQYNDENHPEMSAADTASVDDEKPRKVDATHLVSGEDFRQRVEEGSSGSKFVLAMVLVAVLVGGSYFAFFSGDNGSAKGGKQVATQNKPASSVTVETPKRQPEPTRPATVAPASNVATTKNQPESKPPAKNGQVEVSAVFSDRCWTKVVADGETVYEGIAEKGKTLSWQGKDKITLTAGNAGAVELTYNGKSMGRAGELGQVVDKVFTRERAN
ncbi:MAG: helix-turn-helix domain-containing protein [Selenomonadaceae bacterium]|nr:helix-turn-helix domain-containing protein [Selenomonadaceae bacterium]